MRGKINILGEIDASRHDVTYTRATDVSLVQIESVERQGGVRAWVYKRSSLYASLYPVGSRMRFTVNSRMTRLLVCNDFRSHPYRFPFHDNMPFGRNIPCCFRSMYREFNHQKNTIFSVLALECDRDIRVSFSRIPPLQLQALEIIRARIGIAHPLSGSTGLRRIGSSRGECDGAFTDAFELAAEVLQSSVGRATEAWVASFFNVGMIDHLIVSYT